MCVCIRGVGLGQLLRREPQLVGLSAEKGPEGMRRKEEEVWEQEEEEEEERLRGLTEEIPVPTEKLWEHEEKKEKR